MREILLSIFKILILSSVISLPVWYFLNISLVGLYIITIVIQIVIGYIYNTWSQDRFEKNLSLKQLELQREIEETAAQATCAYCGEINLIPITPGGDNDFDCLHCEKTNAVYLNITVAQKTNLSNLPPYEISNLDSTLEETKKLFNTDENRTG